MKTCTRCHESKPLDNYSRITKSPDGRNSRCRECQSITAREYTQRKAREDPDFWRARNLRINYGITLKERDAKVRAQNGLCAICARPFANEKDTHVDHCHTSGKVRDILCFKCNCAVGKFGDSPETVLRAYHYLVRHQEAQ